MKKLRDIIKTKNEILFVLRISLGVRVTNLNFYLHTNTEMKALSNLSYSSILLISLLM